ncbi:uncharacterized protein LOC121736233 [Aricia agestis]|uniref:uncharacterized protein LOC121736233 n=1 Tax=Aricia agestis TaxID=91739 RepID=UPI001C20540C|nr:uncharacterized protein LOC121736233 [Aricia agestis]
MDLSTQLAANMEDLAKLFQTRMDSYEQRLHQAASTPSHPDLSSLSSEFHDFKNFVWQTLSKFKTQIDLLTLGLDRHETFLRRKILLFHGITENKNENLFNVITDIIKEQLKISEFTSDDIQSCHRLGSPKVKARTVLVRFKDFVQRRAVWDTKTELKSSGIVISEFLTKSRHLVFMAARQHFGVRSCWSTEGKIAVILPDKSRRKIECMEELKSLMATFPGAAKDTKTASAMPLSKTGDPRQSNLETKLPSVAASSRRTRRT